MTTMLRADTAEFWMRRWDAQQERYVADREERFTVIGDVVEHALRAGPANPTILDLGCGPGSLSGRLADRLPEATVIGLDADPLLLSLGRTHYGDRVRFVETDLGGTDWLDQVPTSIHAAVSTTALHWLEPDQLAALYRTLGALLRPGGVFVNGDHLPSGDEALTGLARLVRERRAARVGVTENEEWSAWWEAVRADGELSPLADERSRRAIAHHGSNDLSVQQHADLLRRSGFRSAGPVWQCGDDHVLVGIR